MFGETCAVRPSKWSFLEIELVKIFKKKYVRRQDLNLVNIDLETSALTTTLKVTSTLFRFS